jgi:hypothetical protein
MDCSPSGPPGRRSNRTTISRVAASAGTYPWFATGAEQSRAGVGCWRARSAGPGSTQSRQPELPPFAFEPPNWCLVNAERQGGALLAAHEVSAGKTTEHGCLLYAQDITLRSQPRLPSDFIGRHQFPDDPQDYPSRVLSAVRLAHLTHQAAKHDAEGATPRHSHQGVLDLASGIIPRSTKFWIGVSLRLRYDHFLSHPDLAPWMSAERESADAKRREIAIRASPKA